MLPAILELRISRYDGESCRRGLGFGRGFVPPLSDYPQRAVSRVGGKIELGGTVGNTLGYFALYNVQKNAVYRYVPPALVAKPVIGL